MLLQELKYCHQCADMIQWKQGGHCQILCDIQNHYQYWQNQIL